MKKDIFEYSNYKQYLQSWIGGMPGHGRGIKSAMAKYLRCQTSFISQVLTGEAHFSLEQTDQLSIFLSHSSEESAYFILLVQIARAGTPSLKKRWKSQIDSILEKRLILKERFDIKRTLSQNDQYIYYSSWLYSVVHVMVTVPKFQSIEAIAKHLQISERKISEVLSFLGSIGLITQSQGELKVGEARLFLGSDSHWISKHHMNWRLQAIRYLEKGQGESDLHYSGTWSISEKDFIKIKEHLIRLLDETRTILKTSSEEEVIGFNLDFFKI